MRGKNRIQKFEVRYSSECLLGAECGFFSWGFLEVKVNNGIGDLR
jgi:hypothetical protein